MEDGTQLREAVYSRAAGGAMTDELQEVRDSFATMNVADTLGREVMRWQAASAGMHMPQNGHSTHQAAA